ncbi:ParB N-terminal domain-containing protein, partial [Staphylococcus aureus]|uniref:ParB N-terminal domain-containing protein n=1 Tax=Staphylococcus aureus TaxID=1280 RepID=UPI0016424A5E
FRLKNKDHIIPHIQQDPNTNLQSIQIQPILPNPYQPTHLFQPNKIKQLPQSIHEHPLLQPILLTPIQQHIFQIIPGEPRFTA